MNQISDRLAIFMKKEAMPANGLAELLGVQASGISHILSGRNKPGLEFISRFLNAFPKINPDWFILGKGDMYRSTTESAEAEPELFAEAARPTQSSEVRKDNFDEPPGRAADNPPTSTPPACGHEKTQKSPVKVVVLYSDGTFEAFANGGALDRR